MKPVIKKQRLEAAYATIKALLLSMINLFLSRR